jgi:acyl carrier protein
MLNLAEAQKRAAESLVGFPPRVIEAYLAYAQGGDPHSLDVVVLGVLQFYLAKKPGNPLDTLPGTTRLLEDLGSDSLTMMDTIFMAESLLDIKIDDTELARLTTLDELRGYVRRQVKSSTPSAA